ncbi:MAG TPA: sigma-70 family RNA polymerase sigma factor [Candidatus Limnocylindrales bacterium]|nr:sigma-70 family RNA polymerase sigma factor [Candidatus Limnocylindrales bacterium]
MTALSMQFSAVADDRGALAAALRRRDPDLLDALIQQYEYRLFRYLLYLTGNRETAEDLFQETWVCVMDRGHTYNGRASFETWLFAVARNLTIDAYRRRKPEALDALDGPEIPAGGPSPFEQAAARQSEVRIHESVDSLPAVYREVLLLRFQEELPLNDIAAITGVPLPTVKSRLYRGLEALRREMEESQDA